MYFRLLALLCLSSLTAVSGCTSPSNESTPTASASQTHWLENCTGDSECGELSCLCGICTLPCDTADACQGLQGASCKALDTLQSATCPATLDAPRACLAEIVESPSCDGGNCEPGSVTHLPCEGPECESSATLQAACEGEECSVGTSWPPMPTGTGSCACEVGKVCGASGCEPACDGEGHCAVWPIGGEIMLFKALPDRVVWLTRGERDPAGNPLTGNTLWMAQAGNSEATIIDANLEGSVIDIHDGQLLLTSDQGRMATIALEPGAARTEWTLPQAGDFGGAALLREGIIYGTNEAGTPWRAPLDGSSPPQEIEIPEISDLSLVGSADGYLFAKGILDESWQPLMRLDLSTTPATAQSIDTQLGDSNFWVLDDVIFENEFGYKGQVWDVQTLETRTLFGPTDGNGPGVWNVRMLDEWLYFVRAVGDPDSPEDYNGDPTGLWRVPIRAYGEPERVLDPAVMNATTTSSANNWSHYGVNREGVYWFDWNGSYIYHRELESPACTADDVCGRSSCVEGTCIP